MAITPCPRKLFQQTSLWHGNWPGRGCGSASRTRCRRASEPCPSRARQSWRWSRPRRRRHHLRQPPESPPAACPGCLRATAARPVLKGGSVSMQAAAWGLGGPTTARPLDGNLGAGLFKAHVEQLLQVGGHRGGGGDNVRRCWANGRVAWRTVSAASTWRGGRESRAAGRRPKLRGCRGNEGCKSGQLWRAQSVVKVSWRGESRVASRRHGTFPWRVHVHAYEVVVTIVGSQSAHAFWHHGGNTIVSQAT